MTIKKNIKTAEVFQFIIGCIVSVFINQLANFLFFKNQFSSILSIFIIGISKYKSLIYYDIAKNIMDYSSIYFNLINLLICFIALFGIYRAVQSTIRKKTISQDNITVQQTNKSELKRKIITSLNKLLLYYLIISIFYLATDLIRNSFIRKANIRYHQLMAVVKPYFSEKDFDLLQSDHALIKNKNDYDELINKLINKSIINNLDITNIK